MSAKPKWRCACGRLVGADVCRVCLSKRPATAVLELGPDGMRLECDTHIERDADGKAARLTFSRRKA